MHYEWAIKSLRAGKHVLCEKPLAVTSAQGEEMFDAAHRAGKVLVEAFWHTPQPILDPLGFLHLSLGRAHEEVASLGANLPLEMRPRATCARATACSSTAPCSSTCT